MKIKQISPQESQFLTKLDAIALKPKTLYYYGKIPENYVKVVAIVGSRKITPYGEEIAYRAAYELAKRGVVIVSGLAMGVDAASHRGALDAGGITVGFLGTPIDRMYPKQNAVLANEIIKSGGAVISECPPFDTDISVSRAELEKWHKKLDSGVGAKTAFLHRNRLISGVSDAVIVAEAYEKSGSLNTASHALEQGRILFSVPGDISRLSSKGCNLLFGKGAIAYTNVQDVLDELFISDARGESRLKTVVFDSEEEEKIVRALENGTNDGEKIIRETGLSPAVFNQTITLLEIKGVVRRLYANKWALR